MLVRVGFAVILVPVKCPSCWTVLARERHRVGVAYTR